MKWQSSKYVMNLQKKYGDIDLAIINSKIYIEGLDHIQSPVNDNNDLLELKYHVIYNF